MQKTAADTKTDETNWMLVQGENNLNYTNEFETLTTSMKAIDSRVGTIHADLLQLRGRVCAIESGASGNKSKGKATSPSTPRGSGDPWTVAGADPWQ